MGCWIATVRLKHPPIETVMRKFYNDVRCKGEQLVGDGKQTEPLENRRQVQPSPVNEDGGSATHASHFGKLVGTSPAMQKLFEMLTRAAATDATVLVEGETGTGKEVTANAIHNASERRDGPFIVVDCGAIPGQLLESELFGYQKGAFTGATSSRAGAFEAASGGTIFLDELGELELDLQPKILRVLESRTIKRVGTNHYAPVDVRVIAATNRHLRDEVKAGRFRSDLYYRLAVVHIKLPPLRDREGDLPLLVEAILKQMGTTGPALQKILQAPDFQESLERCAWPGNIRQLRNYLEQRVALGSSIAPPALDSLLPPPQVSASASTPLSELANVATADPQNALFAGKAPEHLAVRFSNTSDQDTSPGTAPPGQAPPDIAFELPLKAARELWNNAFEVRYLQALLVRHNDNVSAAAKEAGVNRVHLYRLLWKHGLRDK